MNRKMILNFPKETTGKPLASQLIRKFDLEMNILKGFVNEDVKGTLLVELSGTEDHLDQGTAFLRDNGLDVREVISVVDVNRDKCVACGACTAACIVGALEMDDQWQLAYHPDKCLECTLCIKACPVRAITTLV
ncbi:MAG: NIL domain-containing protein [Eubacterium sp.]|nr:NIL domain-containing protein [Eubacterium sp.]